LVGIENSAIKRFLQCFPEYSGRIFGRNGKQNRSKFCYELYLTDTETDYTCLKSYGFEVMEKIPVLAATFATSTIRNDEAQINAAWDHLYSKWLQDSMFEYTNEPYYEEYIIKNTKPTKLKLYLPIQKRNEEARITLTENPELCFITAKAKGYQAERVASQLVIDYVTQHYPHIINASKELFLQKDSDLHHISTYTCGIRINGNLQLVEDKNITRITTKHHHYLILESTVMGDYDRYVMMLLSFARDNGMSADKEAIFAVYNTAKGAASVSIKVYCPVKIVIK